MKKFDKLTPEQMENGTPSDNIIIVKSIFSKEAKLVLQPSKDSFSKRYKGIRENVSDIEKSKIGYLPTPSSTIIIKDGVTFDLNDEQDRIDWEWVQHSRHIADDFDAAQQSGLSEAWFYVYRPGAESKKKLEEIKREYDLISKIMNDSPDNLYNRARLLGLDMVSSPLSDVQEYLLTAAKDKRRRSEVIKVYEGKDISTRLLLYHGMDKKVIKNTGFGYNYNGILLGTTEDVAIEFLMHRDNMSIVREMEKEIYPERGTGEEAPVEMSPLEKARAAKVAKKNKNED